MRAPPSAPVAFTPREVAKYFLRCDPAKVRRLIQSGELGAVATRDARGRTRFLVWQCHLDEFGRTHGAAVQAKQPKRRRKSQDRDFYPS
jgi:hypothetical protein